jgi:hypothetical protein
MKICAKCLEEKEFNQFQKHSRCKDGFLSWCNSCKNESKTRIRKDPNNKIKRNIDKTKCRDCGVDNTKDDPKYWKGRCHSCYKVYRRPIMAKYRATDYGKAVRHNWNINMPKASIKRKRQNYQKYKSTQTQRQLQKRKTDPVAKLRHNITTATLSYIKKNKTRAQKCNRTRDLLGCDFKEFKTYFENKFTKFMTWEKFLSGRIQIDHIIPCSRFDLSDLEQQKKCFHYTNLQPLWATTAIALEEGEDENYVGNINKSDRII